MRTVLRELLGAGIPFGPLADPVTAYRRGVRGQVHLRGDCRQLPYAHRGRLEGFTLHPPTLLTTAASVPLCDVCAGSPSAAFDGRPAAREYARVSTILATTATELSAESVTPTPDPVDAGELLTWVAYRRDTLDGLRVPDALAGTRERLLARSDELTAALRERVTGPAGRAEVNERAAWRMVAHLVEFQGAEANLEDVTGQVGVTALGDSREVRRLLRSAFWTWRAELAAGAPLADASAHAVDGLDQAAAPKAHEDLDRAVLGALSPTLDAADFDSLGAYLEAELAAARRALAGRLVGAWAPLVDQVVTAAARTGDVIACWVGDGRGAPEEAIAQVWGQAVPAVYGPVENRRRRLYVGVLPAAVAWLVTAGADQLDLGRSMGAVLGAATAADDADVVALAARLHGEQVLRLDPTPVRDDCVPAVVIPDTVTDADALIAARGILSR